jgi:peptidoglycan hydrolase-like protein with peptidoglycan-binding domain
MLPRSTSRSMAGWLVAALTVTLLGVLPSAPAYAANPVTPGNFTGYGFDQCNAPSQSAMSTWIKKSPFRAAGIYISGNSRACRTQANLTPTWVRNQLAAGWHLMPITLGPQASCSTRFPRYGKNIDPTINPSRTSNYLAARSQGRAEARKAVTTAQGLGIVRGSTLFYDLEAFNISNVLCRNSALWFMNAWTSQLHDLGYASGYYSSAASGIKMLDTMRVQPNNPIKMPDQVWIADWDGKANTTSTYVRSDGWLPYRRMKQYRGGHNETWGGVTINIDRNYLNLRTPKITGSSTPTPPPAPAAPAYTGDATADSRCTPATITQRDYPTVTSAASAQYIVPLQCLLKQQHLYKYAVTGKWNSQTQAALYSFQGAAGIAKQTTINRNTWTALVSRGNSRTLLTVGMKTADATRVQRAMNAAIAARLAVSGTYRQATATAVRKYQAAVGVPVTGTVTAATWAALERGRR